MKISLNWLNEYVDAKEFSKNPAALSKLLTDAGLEVEGYDDPAKHFNNVVVGQVSVLGKHPNADKLTLCQVDVGDGTMRQIVCGAKNHKQGDKVAVALPGAVLPGDFAIKLSKIRDVESQGMLCSESELGFKKESEGIVILPSEAKLGTPIAEFYGLNDIVFEVNVTPNRADCLSHIGIAREVACLLNRKLTLPASEVKTGGDDVKKRIQITLGNKDMCPRYAGRAVWNVKVGPSPHWLKSRIEAAGMTSINNIVDVTNFVMLEYGQPLHAFDMNELRGNKILIENSRREKFKTFMGTELELTGEELTIRDGARAVALAGIIGGLNSGVTDATTEIFIEAAHFDPMQVRRASRRHGVETDSCQRFSRGTDVDGVVEAMNRACALVQKVAGGVVSKDHWDMYPTPKTREAVNVRLKILNGRLGYPVAMSDFVSWMERLHCKIKSGEEEAQVTAPAFRWDLEIEMDFVEEYARLNGYDKIPEAFPILASEPTAHALEYRSEVRAADLLKEQGYLQAVNYGFVAEGWQKKLVSAPAYQALGLRLVGEAVKLINPLSDELNVMRQSLIPGLLINLKYNYNHGNHDGRIFEIGAVMGKAESYNQGHRVALLSWGSTANVWSKPNRPVVYDIKSAVEGMLGGLNASGFIWKKVEEKDVPAFAHPGQIVTLFYQGKTIGFIASLHPGFKEEHKIRGEAAIAEFDLTLLMQGQPKLPKYKKISKFQPVERDFSFVVPQTVMAQDIVREIQKVGAPLLQSVEIVDVFKGGNLKDGESSITFRILLQDLETTLSDEKVTTVTKQVVETVGQKLGLSIRA